jgi:ceramide glucosyltransferase
VPPVWPAIAALILLGLRALVLMVVQQVITGRSRRSISLFGQVLSIDSELLQPLHLLHALCQRRIIWRTRRYAVKANDDFQAV